MVQPNRDDATVKELVERHWGGRAATFDDERQHGIHAGEQHDRWVALLGEWTSDDPRDVLDVGCGTGVISLLLAHLGHDVTGVDVAPEMLARARAKARQPAHSVAFCRGDAECLPVAENVVQLVTARHLVWTLPNPSDAIQEWQRVVEPGGRILLVEGDWDQAEPWDEYEAIHDDLPMYGGPAPDALRAFLLQEGLRDVRIEPLCDPVLWGQEPQHDYYIVAATVPP